MKKHSTGGDRMKSIDAVRGLAIVVMALDHVRDFFYANNLRYSPTDLDSATPAVFLSRWVTKFGARAFVLLAGVGASLWAGRGRSRLELSWFLLTRGLWLVVLELTVIRCLGWYFNFDYLFFSSRRRHTRCLSDWSSDVCSSD